MATADRVITPPLLVRRASAFIGRQPWIWVCTLNAHSVKDEHEAHGMHDTHGEALTAALDHLSGCTAYAAGIDRLLAAVMALPVDAARLIDSGWLVSWGPVLHPPHPDWRVLDDDTAADEIPAEPCDHCTDCGCLIVAGVHRG